MEIRAITIPLEQVLTTPNLYLPGFLAIINTVLNPDLPLGRSNFVQNFGPRIPNALPPLPLHWRYRCEFHQYAVQQAGGLRTINTRIVLRPIAPPSSYELWDGYNHLDILHGLHEADKVSDSTTIRIGIVYGLSPTAANSCSYIAYQKYRKTHYVI